MSKRRQWTRIFLGAVPGALMLTLLWLYVGNEQPLNSQEVDRYLERIGSQTQQPGGRHDLAALRSFLESDDGQPFYTVNLYKFREQARYVDPQAAGATGREAFDRFSQVMLRLLARRSSHPIFGSDWVDARSTEWDRIVIVRYRSRRDIAEIFASPEFAEAGAHKWAALERNGRMLVQGLHIPEFHIPAILLILLSGGFAFAVISNRNHTTHPAGGGLQS